jgi:hypothetical protein
MVERASTSGATLTVQAFAEVMQRPLALIRDPALLRLRPTESDLDWFSKLGCRVFVFEGKAVGVATHSAAQAV